MEKINICEACSAALKEEDVFSSGYTCSSCGTFSSISYESDSKNLAKIVSWAFFAVLFVGVGVLLASSFKLSPAEGIKENWATLDMPTLKTYEMGCMKAKDSACLALVYEKYTEVNSFDVKAADKLLQIHMNDSNFDAALSFLKKFELKNPESAAEFSDLKSRLEIKLGNN